MPKVSSQKSDNIRIHYYLRQTSFGIGSDVSSDRWFKTRKKKLSVFYDIAKETLINSNDEHAIFHSGSQWALIDDELKNLKIKPEETLIIEFNIIVTEFPHIPLSMQIMTYPTMEAVGAAILFFGVVITLTAGLIALIPAIAASIAISPINIAILGGILIAIGITMALATLYCQNELDKAPLKVDFDITMEQKGVPESRQSVSHQTKKKLFPHFFSNRNTEIHSEVEEIIGEESYRSVELPC